MMSIPCYDQFGIFISGSTDKRFACRPANGELVSFNGKQYKFVGSEGMHDDFRFNFRTHNPVNVRPFLGALDPHGIVGVNLDLIQFDEPLTPGQIYRYLGVCYLVGKVMNIQSYEHQRVWVSEVVRRVEPAEIIKDFDCGT